MIKQKRQMNYQMLTVIFAILFFATLIFHTIPNQQQVKYDRYCKGIGLDYANINLVFAEFECCKVYEVLDWEKGITYESEGCLEPFDFGVVK